MIISFPGVQSNKLAPLIKTDVEVLNVLKKNTLVCLYKIVVMCTGRDRGTCIIEYFTGRQRKTRRQEELKCSWHLDLDANAKIYILDI